MVVVDTNVLAYSADERSRRQWFLVALQQSPALGILVPTDRHAAVLSEVIDVVPQLAGNLIHDAATAVLMKEHGIRTIISRDTDFHRFPFLERIDPLTAS
jgi:uncharacterized protein